MEATDFNHDVLPDRLILADWLEDCHRGDEASSCRSGPVLMRNGVYFEKPELAIPPALMPLSQLKIVYRFRGRLAEATGAYAQNSYQRRSHDVLSAPLLGIIRPNQDRRNCAGPGRFEVNIHPAWHRADRTWTPTTNKEDIVDPALLIEMLVSDIYTKISMESPERNHISHFAAHALLRLLGEIG